MQKCVSLVTSLRLFCCPQRSKTTKQVLPYVVEYYIKKSILITFSPGTAVCNYNEALDNIFRRSNDWKKQENEFLALDLGFRVHTHWNDLIEKLASSKNMFSNIDDLIFSDSCFTLKQLLRLYQLFEECKEANMPFPSISINKTPAHEAFLAYKRGASNSTKGREKPISELNVCNQIIKGSSNIDLSSSATPESKYLSNHFLCELGGKDISPKEFLQKASGPNDVAFLQIVYTNCEKNLQDLIKDSGSLVK